MATTPVEWAYLTILNFTAEFPKYSTQSFTLIQSFTDEVFAHINMLSYHI